MAFLASFRFALSASSRTPRPPLCQPAQKLSTISSRSFASSSLRRNVDPPPPSESSERVASDIEEEMHDDDESSEKDDDLPDPEYYVWIKEEGLPFERARKRNWLGDQVPFPLNPSFKPPTPISDALRTIIYNQFMANPELNSVRQLSERYHISMARIDAILRLKGLEAHMVKGRQLQTGFQKGMEDILGVRNVSKKFREYDDWVSSRQTLIEADEVDELMGDSTRTRYQRLFWEPSVEGDNPIMADVLEKSRREAAEAQEASDALKSSPLMLGRVLEAHRPKVVYNTSGAAPGRPIIKFTDVGGKFMDTKDREQRMKLAQRRVEKKAKQRAWRGVMQQRGASQVEVQET